MIIRNKLSRSERLDLLHHENGRRTFLKSAISFLVFPSIYTSLTKSLFGQNLDCPSIQTEASQMIPILFIDLPGGAHLAGEDIVIGGEGGQLDNTGFRQTGSLERFGLPDNLNYHLTGTNIDQSLGLAMHSNSPFLAGVNNTLPASLKNSVDGFSVAGLTRSDTTTNPLGGIHLATTLGRTGLASNSIGNITNSTGGRHLPVVGSVHPESIPAAVRNIEEAQRLSGYGKILQSLDEQSAKRVWDTLSKLGSIQLKKFENLNLNAQVKTLVDCNLIRMKDLPFIPGQGPNDLFPSSIDSNHPLKLAFGNNFLSDTALAQLGIFSHLLLHDYAGAACIALPGGFDNHDSTAANPNLKRFEVGQKVGMLFKYASLIGRSLFVVITTDGAMASKFTNGILEIDSSTDGRGFGVKPGDSDQNSLMFSLAYIHGANRNTNPFVVDDRRQIGAYDPFGVKQILRSSTDNQTALHAIMYNYLKLQNMGDRISRISLTPDLFEKPEYQIFEAIS